LCSPPTRRHPAGTRGAAFVSLRIDAWKTTITFRPVIEEGGTVVADEEVGRGMRGEIIGGHRTSQLHCNGSVDDSGRLACRGRCGLR